MLYWLRSQVFHLFAQFYLLKYQCDSRKILKKKNKNDKNQYTLKRFFKTYNSFLKNQQKIIFGKECKKQIYKKLYLKRTLKNKDLKNNQSIFLLLKFKKK